MKQFIRAAAIAVAAFALAAWVSPVVAGAAARPGGSPSGSGGDHVVFVQTDNTAANQVVAYDRNDDGSLTLTNTYATGGLGGVLNGSAVDHLASQGSLTY